jgi:hypothetical protein
MDTAAAARPAAARRQPVRCLQRARAAFPSPPAGEGLGAGGRRARALLARRASSRRSTARAALATRAADFQTGGRSLTAANGEISRRRRNPRP